MAQLYQSKYKEALNNFLQLNELDLETGFKNELRFDEAKTYAALNDTTKCLQLLDATATDGANFQGRLKDSLFSRMHSSIHFAGIAEKYKENATPTYARASITKKTPST